MKFFKKSVLALAMVGRFALAATAQDKTGWPDTLTIGTGSQGGAYFAYGSGFAGLISEKLGINASVEITGGPGQNVTLVQTNDLNMGFVTMGPAYDAWTGKSEVMPGVEHTAVRALFPMYQTPLQAAVLASSGIKSFKDMEGKRIGVGPASGTSAAYWPRYFEAAGMNVTISSAGASDTAGQLKDGLIDAFVYAAGVPTGAYTQLAVENDVVFISMTEEERNTFLEAEPAMSAFTIPANTYEDQPDPIETVSLWNFAIAHESMSDSLAYEITKLAMEEHERMLQAHQAATETLPEHFDKNSFMPFHPGAAKWFEENGHAIADKLK